MALELSILDEAKAVRLDRAARVDDPAGNFARIAKIWEVVFGHPVTTKQVALAMIGLKLARECYKPWRDNLVDLAGYADCAADIEGYYRVAEACKYDPLEEVYEFRQRCQEERERDAYGPVCGDEPETESSDDLLGGSAEIRQVSADSGTSNWSPRSALRGPFGPNGSSPRATREPLAAFPELAGDRDAPCRNCNGVFPYSRSCLYCGRRKAANGRS